MRSGTAPHPTSADAEATPDQVRGRLFSRKREKDCARVLPGRASHWSVARWGFVLALPMALAGIGIVRVVEAEYVVTREEAHAEAARLVDRLSRDVGAALTAQTDPLLDRLLGARQGDDPVVTARSLIDVNAASVIVLRRDGQPVFPPPGGWDMPANFAPRVSALEAAVSLQPSAEPAGWYAATDGPVFFACRARDAAKACVALDGGHVGSTVRAALATSADSFKGWSLRVRDPFDHLVWAHGGLQFASGEAFDLTGPLRGWRVAAAPPVDAPHGAGVRVAVAAPIVLAWLVLVGSLVVRQRQRKREQEARAELMAQLSHDLRTPLANLKLYAALIARHAESGPTSAKVAGYCDVMDAEIDRLENLAGDTIAFGTAAHRGQLDTGIPDDVLRQTIGRLERLIDAAGCRCEVEAGAGRPCRFDRIAFERIVVNLVDNARKYAPGTIRITTALESDRLRLTVRDWGAGVAVASKDGFGLGLKVVRDLARANDGAIDIVACAPGTRVDVTMRVAPATAGA